MRLAGIVASVYARPPYVDKNDILPPQKGPAALELFSRETWMQLHQEFQGTMKACIRVDCRVAKMSKETENETKDETIAIWGRFEEFQAEYKKIKTLIALMGDLAPLRLILNNGNLTTQQKSECAREHV